MPLHACVGQHGVGHSAADHIAAASRAAQPAIAVAARTEGVACGVHMQQFDWKRLLQDPCQYA